MTEENHNLILIIHMNLMNYLKKLMKMNYRMKIKNFLKKLNPDYQLNVLYSTKLQNYQVLNIF